MAYTGSLRWTLDSMVLGRDSRSELDAVKRSSGEVPYGTTKQRYDSIKKIEKRADDVLTQMGCWRAEIWFRTFEVMVYLRSLLTSLTKILKSGDPKAFRTRCSCPARDANAIICRACGEPLSSNPRKTRTQIKALSGSYGWADLNEWEVEVVEDRLEDALDFVAGVELTESELEEVGLADGVEDIERAEELTGSHEDDQVGVGSTSDSEELVETLEDDAEDSSSEEASDVSGSDAVSNGDVDEVEYRSCSDDDGQEREIDYPSSEDESSGQGCRCTPSDDETSEDGSEWSQDNGFDEAWT